MLINTIGFPTNLFGAGGAAPDAGLGFAQLLGAPVDPAGAAMGAGAGLTPPLAANDKVAPAATMSMAQLLTTAAPLAPSQLAVAAPAPAPVAPDASQPVVADPAAAVAVPEAPEAALPQVPGKPVVQVKPNQPGKPEAKPKPEAGLDLLADPAPEAPVTEAPVAETPAEEAKTPTPVKRGPRLSGDVAEEIPITADAQPVVADAALVAVVTAQAPVRPELAVKPQPSPTRQIGEVGAKSGKADTVRGEPAAQPAAANDKAEAAVSAIAGKSGDTRDNSASDERGQAPAFTLRQDTHAAAPVHATSETARTQATSAVTAAEPVIAARPGHLGQQMGVEIARKVEAGEDTLRVRLSPDNLGKVEVTLSFDNGGKLHATVRAESQHALEMLRQDAPDLGRALDQAGIRTDAGSFRFESRSDGGGAQQQQTQNPSGGQFAGNDETDTTETAYQEIRGDGQVDLLA